MRIILPFLVLAIVGSIANVFFMYVFSHPLALILWIGLVIFGVKIYEAEQENLFKN